MYSRATVGLTSVRRLNCPRRVSAATDAAFAAGFLASSRKSSTSRCAYPSVQGLTLVHFSAQPKRILWDRGAFRDRLGGV